MKSVIRSTKKIEKISRVHKQKGKRHWSLGFIKTTFLFVLGPGEEPTVRNQTWVLPLGAGDPVIV